MKNLSRFFLWDTMTEYEFPNAPAVESREELFAEVESWEAGPGGVVFQCMEDDEAGALDYACQLCEAVGDVTLIIEEVDTYATPNIIPAPLRRLIKKGRHWGVSLVFVSSAPSEIHRLCTSQSRRMIVFRLIEESHLKYVRRALRDHVDLVPELPDLHFLDWQQDKGIERGVISFEK